MNVDASVFPEENFFTIGIVIRDYSCHFWKDKTTRIKGKVSVLEA